MSKKEKEAFVDHLCLLLKSQFSNKYSEINLSAHLNRSVNSVYLEERRGMGTSLEKITHLSQLIERRFNFTLTIFWRSPTLCYEKT